MCNHKLVSLLLAVATGVLLNAPVVAAQERAEDSAESSADAPAVETQAYLGLGVAPLHPALTAQLPEITGEGRGVLVEHVMQESPAERAGLKQHDILVAYDDQDLYSPEQLVKLVRNDEPGREVSLVYVRAGKTHDATVRLGEVPERTPVRGQAGVEMPSDARPALSTVTAEQQERMDRRERQRQNDPRPWARFKSMTVTKLGDGEYRAEIDFRDKDEKILHREYVGTREEIRKAIQQDEALPDDEREHLLRSLDQQTPGVVRFQWPSPLRDFFDLDAEYFNWPNLDF